MKKAGLLNPELNRAIARLGHTDTFVVADCGLPVPANVPLIDLALVFGIPRFADVLGAVLVEVVVEGFTIASEARQDVRNLLAQRVPEAGIAEVPHEEFKRLVADAAFVVRTGETTPFANVLVHCGVPF
ncbi:D-ribose pyranase [Trueperella abortisuis]|uniref:D-ribose pyranase n=1 Tax=Trueperella abortisuis TaxID=445930 RepID=UPI002892E8F4|nr:D-ribose pyranase [Trueperella abortisuis]